MRKRNTLRELFRSLFLISIHFDVLAIVTLLPSHRRRSSHTRRTFGIFFPLPQRARSFQRLLSSTVRTGGLSADSAFHHHFALTTTKRSERTNDDNRHKIHHRDHHRRRRRRECWHDHHRDTPA
uniref:Putative secreted protein n=1 Tax=Anopheles darlingi TaxID=43151 RepID=A0A2M4DDM8_ANODA